MTGSTLISTKSNEYNSKINTNNHLIQKTILRRIQPNDDENGVKLININKTEQQAQKPESDAEKIEQHKLPYIPRFTQNPHQNQQQKTLNQAFDHIKKHTINYAKKFPSLNFRRKFKLNRLVHKNGESNINRINLRSRSRKYIADLFTTLIDMKWLYMIILFILSFLLSWLIFGGFWHSIQRLQDDCIVNLSKNNFVSSLLFSIETQQTIGYGSRYLNDNCGWGALLVMLQSCFSILLQSFMGGIVFAKLSIPKKRTETLIFSKNAVLALRDGVYCLMCRVGDMRKSHIIQARVSMYLIRSRRTREGEYIPCNIQELSVDTGTGTDRLLLMPIIVEHRVNENSPLWDLVNKKIHQISVNESTSSATSSMTDTGIKYESFHNEDFEIIVTLEGTVESTGATTQARTSYLPKEILWNRVFSPLFISFIGTKPTIDFSKFDETISLDTIKIQFETDENATSSNQNTVSSIASSYLLNQNLDVLDNDEEDSEFNPNHNEYEIQYPKHDLSNSHCI